MATWTWPIGCASAPGVMSRLVRSSLPYHWSHYDDVMFETSEPSSDASAAPASVRLALPREATQIAEVQRRRWLADPLTRLLAAGLEPGEMTRVWTRAITRPPMAHCRVLVALQPGVHATGDTSSPHADRVCGFAAIAPSNDPDADDDDLSVEEFCLDPDAGPGHADRLMHAVADTARSDGYRRLTWWIASSDDPLRAWLTASGWDADGAHRELATPEGDAHVRQVRMHTMIFNGRVSD